MALSETLHFGRAAAKLGLGQPAVSQLLKDLERTRRAAELTVAGHQFLLHARRALEAVDDATRAARRAGEGELGSVVLGMNAMSARYPLVKIRLQPDGTVQLLEAVRTGQCDFAFIIAPGDVAPLQTEALTSNSLCAVLPASHPMSRRKRVRVAQLASDPQILMPRHEEPNLRAANDALFAAIGRVPNVLLETNQIETVFAFVGAGLAICLLPTSARRLSYPGVRFVELTPKVVAEISMVWNPARLSAPAQRFLDSLRAERDA